MLIVTDHIHISLKEIYFTFARSSGPGGQKVNKTNSKAVLHWSIPNSHSIPNVLREQLLSKLQKTLNENGEIVIHSDKYRDRGRNVSDALEKLKKIIIQATHVSKKRIKTKPTLSAKEKRLSFKHKHSEIKQNRKKIW